MEGRITLYKDRFEFSDGSGNTKVFPANSVKSLAVILVNTMLFTADDEYYEARLSERSSALQYLISYYYINGKEYKR